MERIRQSPFYPFEEGVYYRIRTKQGNTYTLCGMTSSAIRSLTKNGKPHTMAGHIRTENIFSAEEITEKEAYSPLSTNKQASSLLSKESGLQ